MIRHVTTCGGAVGADRDRVIRDRDTGFLATPSEAQRSAIEAHAARTMSALRQRPAGRRGVAGMPAEEHVEPRTRLREAPSAPSRPAAEPKADTNKADAKTETEDRTQGRYRAGRTGGKAGGRDAGDIGPDGCRPHRPRSRARRRFRDQQCLSLRLSEVCAGVPPAARRR